MINVIVIVNLERIINKTAFYRYVKIALNFTTKPEFCGNFKDFKFLRCRKGQQYIG